VIASLNGIVARKDIASVVLDVSGVGYLVTVLPQTSSNIQTGDKLFLHTAHIIREDSQALFGFETSEELAIFQLLCSVNGVGPKSAMAVVGQLGVDGVGEAVNSVNDEMFRSVSGIGPKTAKLIVLNLSGKLVIGAESTSSASDQVLSALISLGYQDRVARDAIKQSMGSSSNQTEGELLKSSLLLLSKSRKG
jgi:Holliday junction DNA helicase RuvA